MYFLKPKKQSRNLNVYGSLYNNDAINHVKLCVRAYWDSLCTRIETARDSGNIKEMFEAIKTATGPSIQTAGVLKKKDGTVIEDQDQKLNRWIEHYSELYGTEGTADHAYITNLPATATDHSLDEHPDSDEIIQIIQSLRSGKAAGEDEIPAELLKAGIEPLAESILHLISACWSSKSVPQDFKNAKITTLYNMGGQTFMTKGHYFGWYPAQGRGIIKPQMVFCICNLLAIS